MKYLTRYELCLYWFSCRIKVTLLCSNLFRKIAIRYFIHIIQLYLYHHFQVLKHIKRRLLVYESSQRLLVAVQCCSRLKPLTGITCKRTGDSVATLLRWISRQVPRDCTVYFPVLTLPSLTHHSSVTSLKGWCLSLWGCLFRCGQPGHCGMPGAYQWD